MFEATAPFLFFDYFRIPYRLAPGTHREPFAPGHPMATSEWLRWPDGDGSSHRSLHWVNLDQTRAAHPRELMPGEYRLDSDPVFGHVATDAASSEWLRASGRIWVPRAPVTDRRGRRVESIW